MCICRLAVRVIDYENPLVPKMIVSVLKRNRRNRRRRIAPGKLCRVRVIPVQRLFRRSLCRTGVLRPSSSMLLRKQGNTWVSAVTVLVLLPRKFH